MVLGVDFDNTIVDYGELMHEIASQWRLVGRDCPKTKKAVRDSIRRLPEGELHWRRLQAEAYGARMQEARPAAGVGDLFLTCRNRGIAVYIVSHKTECSNLGQSDVSFRTAAVAWLESSGFFDPQGIALERTRVFFHDSRQEKIERIRSLRVTHFIDDLEELFHEPLFPKDVVPILFSPERPSSDGDRIRSFASWNQIADYVLGGVCVLETSANHG